MDLLKDRQIKRIHCLIKGRVQGVFFRDSTERRAENLALVGYVRNLSDGRVEVEAEGSEDKLQQLLEFLHQGPPAARVDEVEVEWWEPERKENDFQIK